ncbi:hypothetical protein [Nitrincola sp.]|uniref:hypothetical protein n=1 Tax=Nitrincola sp. TaxID=1926584 RepID=UPI003A8F61F6
MMNQTAYQHRLKPTQARGISLIAVLFILIVLGGLAAVMAQMGATQHAGYLLSQQGKQAYYSARSGLEWLQHQTLENGACPAVSNLDFSGFDLTLSCEEITETEDTDTLKIFHLGSHAQKSSGPFGMISRETRVSVWLRSS